MVTTLSGNSGEAHGKCFGVMWFLNVCVYRYVRICMYVFVYVPSVCAYRCTRRGQRMTLSALLYPLCFIPWDRSLTEPRIHGFWLGWPDTRSRQSCLFVDHLSLCLAFVRTLGVWTQVFMLVQQGSCLLGHLSNPCDFFLKCFIVTGVGLCGVMPFLCPTL